VSTRRIASFFQCALLPSQSFCPSFLPQKLKDIGPSPSSPKALGDLLMRWVCPVFFPHSRLVMPFQIDDLDVPYTTYCTRYRCGFDTWLPVQSNRKLPDILSTFSASNPPLPTSTSSIWTLDDLFLLPKARLKYYKKLYGRLLKSTAPGRSDHRLLLGAVATLDRLLHTLEAQSSVTVADTTSPGPSAPAPRGAEKVIIDSRTNNIIEEQDNSAQAVTNVAPENGGSSSPASSTSGE